MMRQEVTTVLNNLLKEANYPQESKLDPDQWTNVVMKKALQT